MAELVDSIAQLIVVVVASILCLSPLGIFIYLMAKEAKAVTHRDWYAEGFRFDEMESLRPGDFYTVSYVEREEIEEVVGVAILDDAVYVNGRVYPRSFKNWIKHKALPV